MPTWLAPVHIVFHDDATLRITMIYIIYYRDLKENQYISNAVSQWQKYQFPITAPKTKRTWLIYDAQHLNDLQQSVLFSSIVWAGSFLETAQSYAKMGFTLLGNFYFDAS